MVTKRYSSFTNNWNRETILNLVKTYTNTNYLFRYRYVKVVLFNESNKVDGTEYYNFFQKINRMHLPRLFTDFLMHQLQKGEIILKFKIIVIIETIIIVFFYIFIVAFILQLYQ